MKEGRSGKSNETDLKRRVREGEALEVGRDADARLFEKRRDGRTVGKLARVRRLGDDVVCEPEAGQHPDAKTGKRGRKRRTLADDGNQFLEERLLLLVLVAIDRRSELAETLRASKLAGVKGVRSSATKVKIVLVLDVEGSKVATMTGAVRVLFALVRRGERPVVRREKGDVCVGM